ncbi:MAG: DEAD/DEAH box helicase [Bacteroidota bacterium]
MLFTDLNLNKPLLNAIEDLGFVHPTRIQEQVFAVAMSGSDVVGIAQTGTGKTYAYLLPLLRLWKYNGNGAPQILIVVPTRELVVQVADEVKKLSMYMNVITIGVYGGVNIKTQMAAIHAGVDVLVGTPGRLLDLALTGVLRTKFIKKFVIDEVDEMLNLGFRPQLNRIIELLPVKRQNLMFSATMTEEIDALIQDYFNFPKTVEAAPTGTPLENIIQIGYKVPNFYTKVNLLKHLLANKDEMKKVLVFASTKKLADRIFDEVQQDFPEQLGVIHSNKAQNNRFNSVRQFHAGEYRILIATDIMARGLDVSEITHVVNFDIPEVAESYMHRIGRTGRADKEGIAITFLREQDAESLAAIEELMKYKVPMKDLPEEIVISGVLLEEEKPVIIMKTDRLPPPRIGAGLAFHEKSEKNQKVNAKVRYVDKMKKKYGKPKKRRPKTG